jgi:hypothetical protein
MAGAEEENGVCLKRISPTCRTGLVPVPKFVKFNLGPGLRRGDNPRSFAYFNKPQY